MPPKVVTCCICKQEVLKAQTMAIKDGRACRSHDGVEQKAQQRQKDEALKNAKPMPRQSPSGFEHRFDLEKFEQDAAKFREEAYSHCWTCGCEGISLKEYFAQCMIASHRLKLRGEWNFLTLHSDMDKLMGNPVVLSCLPYDEEKDRKIYRDITNRKIKGIIHVLRFVNMCGKCIVRHNVRDRLEALMPEPTMEQIKAMMPVVVALEPVLDVLAEEKENQN